MCACALAETRLGKLEGVFENGLFVFKGVPYAAPPVGAFRWLPPQPLRPWVGIKPAFKYGNIAPQNVMALPGIQRELEPQSEDCLFLNIYTKGLDDARRPVMVWIHGGAFSMGSGSMQMFRGGSITSNGNVVLVTFNYRLGGLGFLDLNELTEGRIPSTGNEGLQDQIAALRWVKDNISVFGGDPDNITVFGGSAGAISIGCLLSVHKARGLFHKAILQSPIGKMARTREVSVKIAQIFLNQLGIKADHVAELRSVPIKRLLKSQRATAIRAELGAAPFMPVADGIVLPQLPLESLEAGMGFKVPVLTGSNLEEDKLFSMMDFRLHRLDEQGLRRAVSRFVAERDVAKLIEVYRSARTRRSEAVTPFELYSAINTDAMFRKTAIRISEVQCKFAPAGYNYLFCWKSKTAERTLGACHALEIGFVFGNHNPAFGTGGPEADKLSRRMQDAWINFARNGNPSCDSLGEWPQYGHDRLSMILDRHCYLEKAPYEEEREIWETIEELNPDSRIL